MWGNVSETAWRAQLRDSWTLLRSNRNDACDSLVSHLLNASRAYTPHPINCVRHYFSPKFWQRNDYWDISKHLFIYVIGSPIETLHAYVFSMHVCRCLRDCCPSEYQLRRLRQAVFVENCNWRVSDSRLTSELPHCLQNSFHGIITANRSPSCCFHLKHATC